MNLSEFLNRTIELRTRPGVCSVLIVAMEVMVGLLETSQMIIKPFAPPEAT